MISGPLKFHFQRFEVKYRMPLDLIEGIVPTLLKYMDWDPFAVNLSERAYRVSSLYYDSAGLDAYHQKITGLEHRKKFRLRYYDEVVRPETLIFWEIKRKHDAVVVKDRLVMPYAQTVDILENMKLPAQVPAEQRSALEEFLWAVRHNGMYPRALIVYKRRPFVSKIDPQFRVTIDYGVSAQITPTFDMQPRSLIEVMPGTAILEVKYNNSFPGWFHSIVQKYNLTQWTYSKYCFGLEACLPELAGLQLAEHPAFY